ncbi:MAG: hypothetical protein R2795_16235 [Saprospiraceae bacterium]
MAIFAPETNALRTMDVSFLIMWIGFFLAGYAVVGNDSIQTLGTFLSSNEERPWYILWLFAGGILTFTLLYGWYAYGGDVSYDRLKKYAFIEEMTWHLPPATTCTHDSYADGHPREYFIPHPNLFQTQGTFRYDHEVYPWLRIGFCFSHISMATHHPFIR